MIPRVRKMCDGEELVMVECPGSLAFVDTDPREALYDQRSRAVAERRRSMRALPFRQAAESRRDRRDADARG